MLEVIPKIATRRKVLDDEGFTRFMMNTFEPMFLPGSDETEKKRIIDRACTQPEHASIDICVQKTLNLRIRS